MALKGRSNLWDSGTKIKNRGLALEPFEWCYLTIPWPWVTEAQFYSRLHFVLNLTDRKAFFFPCDNPTLYSREESLQTCRKLNVS